MEDKEYLSMDLHPFVLGWHMVASRKVMRARSEHYKLIMVGTDTIVVDVLQKIFPDGVDLIMTLSVAQESLAQTRLVLDTFLGQQHAAVVKLKTFR